MQAMKCEICGSNDIVKQNGLFVCQHCGTKYSIEEAKKLIGVVSIDKSGELENWKVLAKRARSEGNAQNAAKYYGLINEQNPHDWEASFFYTYYQSVDCKLAQIPSAQSAVTHAFYSTLIMLGEDTAMMSESDKNACYADAFRQIFDACSSFADSIVSSALKYRKESASTTVAINSSNEWIASAMTLVHVLGVAAKEYVRNDPVYFAILDKDIKLHSEYAYVLKPEIRDKTLQELKTEIRKIDPDYVMPGAKDPNKGCITGFALFFYEIFFGSMALAGFIMINKAANKGVCVGLALGSVIMAVLPYCLRQAKKTKEEKEKQMIKIRREDVEGKVTDLINQICDKEFTLTSDGYKKEDVDAFLNKICDEISSPDDSTLSWKTLYQKEFDKEKNGYSISEVDTFLDLISSQLWPRVSHKSSRANKNNMY